MILGFHLIPTPNSGKWPILLALEATAQTSPHTGQPGRFAIFRLDIQHQPIQPPLPLGVQPFQQEVGLPRLVRTVANWRHRGLWLSRHAQFR
jgi:hypothetical protein